MTNPKPQPEQPEASASDLAFRASEMIGFKREELYPALIIQQAIDSALAAVRCELEEHKIALFGARRQLFERNGELESARADKAELGTALAGLHIAASRISTLFEAEYLRARSDGGRVEHAMGLLTSAIRAATVALSTPPPAPAGEKETP